MDIYSCTDDGYHIYIHNYCETRESTIQTNFVRLRCTSPSMAERNCKDNHLLSENEGLTVEELQGLNNTHACMSCCRDICYASSGGSPVIPDEHVGHVYIITASVIVFTFLILLIVLAVYIRRFWKNPVRATTVMQSRQYEYCSPEIPSELPPPLPPPRVNSLHDNEDDTESIHSNALNRCPKKLNSFTVSKSTRVESQRPSSVRTTSFSSLESDVQSTRTLSFQSATENEEKDACFSEAKCPTTSNVFSSIQDSEVIPHRSASNRRTSFSSLKSDFENLPLVPRASLNEDSDARTKISELKRHTKKDSFDKPHSKRITSPRPHSIRKSSFRSLDIEIDKTPSLRSVSNEGNAIPNSSVRRSLNTRSINQRPPSVRKTSFSSQEGDTEKTPTSNKKNSRKSQKRFWLEEHEVNAILAREVTRTTPPPLPPPRRSFSAHSELGTGSTDREPSVVLLGLEPAFHVSRLVRDIKKLPMEKRRRTQSTSSTKTPKLEWDRRPSSLF